MTYDSAALTTPRGHDDVFLLFLFSLPVLYQSAFANPSEGNVDMFVSTLSRDVQLLPSPRPGRLVGLRTD